MTRSLDLETQAYNSIIEAINDKDRQLDTLIESRERLWQAAQAIIALSQPARRKIVETRR